MYNEHKVNLLRSIFNTKNRFIIPDKLFEIIKFGNKNESLKDASLRLSFLLPNLIISNSLSGIINLFFVLKIDLNKLTLCSLYISLVGFFTAFNSFIFISDSSMSFIINQTRIFVEQYRPLLSIK